MKSGSKNRAVSFLIGLSLLIVWVGSIAASQRKPLPGYTLHFDFFNSTAEAERLFLFAIRNGARVLNVVPPSRLWTDPVGLQTLRRIFKLAEKNRVKIVLTRIDASSFSSDPLQRSNWLYDSVLNQRGRLPDGSETPGFFCATVGNTEFAEWQRRETEFYAENFSGEKSLIGFSIGMFNEPFVSQRGSLLCYDFRSKSYEIAQYTPFAEAWWREWLKRRFHGSMEKTNHNYETSFSAFAEFPLPANEIDNRYGKPFDAYRDFACSLNDWVVERYEECLSIWHAKRRREIPFILQFSGFEPEKLAMGRPAFAALDIFDWMMRADALGLSLYTNSGYPDRGHASDQAMIHYLSLGRLLGKPVFLLESGYEDDGAVLDAGELDFFLRAPAVLKPVCRIYEFLKMTYDENFANSSGKIVKKDWSIDIPALTQIKAVLRRAAPSAAKASFIYILDDYERIKESPAELQVNKELLTLALDFPLVFVPPSALSKLPASSVLAVPESYDLTSLQKTMKRKKLEIISRKTLIQRLHKKA